MDLSEANRPTAAQMEHYMQAWEQWLEGLRSGGHLAPGGHHLAADGRVLRKGQMTDGPYTARSASLAGYILVLAEDMDQATELARPCPILAGEDTSVEIRETGDAS